jgi:hypothetical protein
MRTTSVGRGPLAFWLIALSGCSSSANRIQPGAVHGTDAGQSGSRADNGQVAAPGGSTSAGESTNASGGADGNSSSSATNSASAGDAGATTTHDASSANVANAPADADNDGGAPSCPHDQYYRPSSEVKACQVDADCTMVPTYTCLGPGPVYGLAKAAQKRYPACFVVSHPVNCPHLSGAAYVSTEDGQVAGQVTPRCLVSFPAASMSRAGTEPVTRRCPARARTTSHDVPPERRARTNVEAPVRAPVVTSHARCPREHACSRVQPYPAAIIRTRPAIGPTRPRPVSIACVGTVLSFGSASLSRLDSRLEHTEWVLRAPLL